MPHLPQLIVDLALILTVAGIVTVLFRKIRQPLVLGYIIAGLLVSSHFPFFPSITDVPNIRIWADIGVIFLLFALGLEFSFKKVLRIGSAAGITGIFEISGMIVIGFGAGQLLGWSRMDSLFLGGIMAISSTSIIIRAFEELGVKGRRFVDLVFGVLIVEDLVAILLLVFLSTIAVRNQLEGMEMVSSIAKLGFFLLLWFLSGIFLIPTLLRYFRKSINEETLLVVAVGLCFFMVTLATKAGFSPALGAFLMGSILAETTEAEAIEKLISPVKDLFAAIFFVSVGMLIDPSMLLKHVGPVLMIAGLLIVSKTTQVIIGALLSGQSLRHAVQSGFSLAQIGEFSFIIAALGDSLKVTSDFLYPIAVGVSVITTFSTPYMMRAADPFAGWLERKLPEHWKNNLNRYGNSMHSISISGKWAPLLKSYALRVVFNGVIVVGIFALSGRFLPPLIEPWLGEEAAQWVALLFAVLPSAPFLWAMAIGRPQDEAILALLESRRYRAPVFVLEFFRVTAAMVLFALLAPKLISLQATLTITGSMAVLVLFVFSRHLDTVYHWIEGRFIQNLSQRETEAKASSPSLAPWDGHLAQFEAEPDSTLIGAALKDLGIREKFGITIALIERGHKKIPAPGPDEKIYPFDKVFAIGSDEDLVRFRQLLETSENGGEEDSIPYGLEQIELKATSLYCGKNIRQSGIREQTSGLVVGIERGGERLLNPDATTVLQAGDLLWVVGDKRRIGNLHE